MSGTIDLRQPRYGLTVGGRTRSILGGTVELGTDIFVATADLTLDPGEGRPTVGDAVAVRAGYVGDYPLPLIFTGTIDDDSLQLWPWDGTIKCSGILNRATTPIGTPRLPTDPGYGNLPLPTDPAHDPDVVAYYDSAGSGRTWTDGQIVTDILARYGIVDVQIADSGTVLATLNPLVITRAQNGAQVIQEIDELLGYRTYDGPDGVVRRVAISLNPSAGYARRYVEGADLYRATHTRTRRQVRNRVVCQGSVPNLRGSTGTPYQPIGLAQASSPYVPTPPGYQEHTWATNLAETQALCQAYARRKLGELNRLAETASYDLMQGDSRLAPNMTVRIDAPHLSLGDASRSRLVHVRHQIGPAFATTIQVVTVTRAEGVNPNQPPVALIDAVAERETLADGTTLTIVALDGTNSYDPDGQAGMAVDRGIASYLWTASQGTITATSGGRLATLTITGPVAPSASVTLTVTASDNGATGTTTRLIGASGLPVQVRDIWAALTTDLQFSNDGQKTWQSFGIAAVGVCEVAAPTYNLAWDRGGALYRCMSDLTSTVCGGPTGVTAASISLDTQGVPTHLAWAAGANGAVWRSTDDGQTWPAAAPIPTSGAVTAIAESPYSPGDVTAVAGATTWHSYDAGASWQAQDSYPDPAYAAQRFVAGIAADGVARGYTAYTGPAPASGAATGVVRERSGLVTTSFPSTAAPLQITGLTLSLDGTSLLATDIPSAPPARTWQIDATAGGTWTPRAYNSAFGNPRHIIRDGRLPGLIYGAADSALFKTPDEFGTTYAMRNLTGTLAGKMIGYGDLHPAIVASAGGNLTWIGFQGANAFMLRATPQGFVNLGPAPAQTDRGTFPSRTAHLLKLADGVYLLLYGYLTSSTTATPPANMFVTRDDGATWNPVAGVAGGVDVTLADDGTLYCITQQTSGAGVLLVSTDAGANWTTRNGGLTVYSGGQAYATNVAVDPTNSQALWLTHMNGMQYSSDGGATFGAAMGPGASGQNDNEGPSLGARQGGLATKLRHTNSPSPIAYFTPTAGYSTTYTVANNQVPFLNRDRQALYMGSAATGIYASFDGGLTWQDQPNPNLNINATMAGIGVDPVSGDVSLAATGMGTGTATDPYRYNFLVLHNGVWTDQSAALVKQLGGTYSTFGGLAVQ